MERTAGGLSYMTSGDRHNLGSRLMYAFCQLIPGAAEKVRAAATKGLLTHIRGDKDGRGDMSAVNVSPCLVIRTQARARCKARTFGFAKRLALLSAGECIVANWLGQKGWELGIAMDFEKLRSLLTSSQLTDVGVHLLCKRCQPGRCGPGRSSGILQN